MVDVKINFIITYFLIILFLLIGFYYIIADIVKNIRKNKIIKVRKEVLERERIHKKNDNREYGD